MPRGGFVGKYETANKWLRLQNRQISILQHLRDKGITKIILYGTSEFALRLLEQCENENNIVKVIGITDKKISSRGAYYKDIPLMSLDDIQESDVNNVNDTCVVITAMGFYDEIAGELQMRGITNYVSLREVIEDA